MIEPTTDPAVVPARKKAMVYVDGFNLYFGIMQGSPDLKWLDLQAFMDFLRPDEEVVGVRYFTAQVDPQNISRSPGIVRNATFKPLDLAHGSRL